MTELGQSIAKCRLAFIGFLRPAAALFVALSLIGCLEQEPLPDPVQYTFEIDITYEKDGVSDTLHFIRACRSWPIKTTWKNLSWGAKGNRNECKDFSPQKYQVGDTVVCLSFAPFMQYGDYRRNDLTVLDFHYTGKYFLADEPIGHQAVLRDGRDGDAPHTLTLLRKLPANFPKYASGGGLTITSDERLKSRIKEGNISDEEYRNLPNYHLDDYPPFKGAKFTHTQIRLINDHFPEGIAQNVCWGRGIPGYDFKPMICKIMREWPLILS